MIQECWEIWPLPAVLLASSVILEKSLNLYGPQFSSKIGRLGGLDQTNQTKFNEIFQTLILKNVF